MPITLAVHDFGVSLGKKSERIVVRKAGAVVREVPFFRVNEILVPDRGASISTELIAEACERGIRIAFLRGGGRPFALLSSPMMVGTIETRREQHAAYHDRRGVELARSIVRAKLVNQTRLLRYFAKYRKAADPDVFAEIDRAADAIEAVLTQVDALPDDAPCIAQARERLLGFEGAGARVYWDGVRALLRGKVSFPGRRHPGTET